MEYRVVHRLVMIPDEQFVPITVCTRGHDLKFHQIYARTNYYKYTFFPSIIPLWNSLPDNVASAKNLDDFKEKLAEVHLPS